MILFFHFLNSVSEVFSWISLLRQHKFKNSSSAKMLNSGMKTYKQLKEEIVGRVQVHYDSVNGYGKSIKVIATVPPMTEPPIENKYELMRYLEKYIKKMKADGVIKSNYKIVHPHDSAWRKSGKNG